jgi:hypothetical protein
MPKLVVNKDTTLFRPIEIELEGKSFASLPMSPALLRKLTAKSTVDPLASPPEIEIVLEQLGLIFGVGPEEFENTDHRDLRRILEFVGEQIALTGEKYQGPVDEKNSPGPEDGQSH